MNEAPLLSFPCDLPIKVLGRNERAFRRAAQQIIQSHYGELDQARIGEQLSRNGSFLSLTFNVRAESREQVDTVYRALTASDDILIVL